MISCDEIGEENAHKTVIVKEDMKVTLVESGVIGLGLRSKIEVDEYHDWGSRPRLKMVGNTSL